MNSKSKEIYKKLRSELIVFQNNFTPLVGISDSAVFDTFIKQIIDSMRRIEYVFAISKIEISKSFSEPSNSNFDPIKAAIYKKQHDDIDEAFWLIFLSINYGKNLKHGWRMTREIYGGLENNFCWTWEKLNSNRRDFKEWITANYKNIQCAFGNHRKYESLRPDTQKNPSDVIFSYLDWVGSNQNHQELMNEFNEKCNSNSRLMFSQMYKSMDSVLSFGRTAKFDYLTMIAKIGLVNIEPDSTYMQGATGPASGAKLLFFGNKSSKKSNNELEKLLRVLEENLPIGEMGMQVIEDALCNWQKSPSRYRLFRG